MLRFVFVCVFVVGWFLLLCSVTGVPPFFFSLAFDAQGRHSSKTVAIVMMSAAPEQKKRRECTSRSDRRNQVHKHTATTNTTPTQPQQFRRGSAKQFPVCNM